MTTKDKEKEEERKSQEELAAAKADKRRADEVAGDAAQDPIAKVKCRFTGGSKGTAKHREWKGEKPNRHQVLLKKNDTVTMTRRRYAALSDRFTLA